MMRLVDQSLYEIIQQIRPLFRALAKTVENKLEGSGITVGMRAVLEQLHDHGPQTVPQIGRSLSIGRQFIQRLVNSLSTIGLVKIVSNPAHLRSSLIELTPEGEMTIKRIRAREQALLRQMARHLDRGDIEACLRVLAFITTEFREIARGDESDGS
jgi:DNA-binding MarR family transcriptional regulator